MFKEGVVNMGTVDKLHGNKLVDTSPVVVYENFNLGIHEGYLFFTALASGDVFNITISVLDLESGTYKVLRSVPISYEVLQNFTEKGIHIMPRFADNFKIEMTKTSGTQRTVNYTMYNIKVT